MGKSLRSGIWAALLFVAASAAWCLGRSEPADRPLVVATIFPDYDFARVVAGNRLGVRLLIPPGIEAHTYEPRPLDIRLVARAAAFVYTGATMEPWVDGFLEGVGNRRLLVVDTSSGIVLAERRGGVGDGAEDGHVGELDPHIWLDPTLAARMVQTIADAFAAMDPAGESIYRANAQSYRERLEDLDRLIAAELRGSRGMTIIYGGHFAFGYFARRYGLEYLSPYRGFSPDAEPTPQAVAQLIETLRAARTRVVFHEELLEPRVARAIAEATGARLELLHGVHNVTRAELDGGASYLSIMEDNLRKLKEALVGP